MRMFSALLFVLYYLAAAVHATTVLAIDFGDESLKIAVIGSALPMKIVLNGESNRKTPTMLSIRNSERKFGSEAVSMSMRFPESAYPHLKSLLGKLHGDIQVKKFMEEYSNGLVRDEKRGTVAFESTDGQIYSVEVLVAMILKNAKYLAEADTKRSIDNCVITIPSYFNFYERRAMLDAAKLANLNVLELINEGTAAALSYAYSRHSFTEAKSYCVFLDIGSSSAVTTVVSYENQVITENGKNNTHSIIEILATKHDEVGGQTLDISIKNHLIRKFLEKNPKARMTPKANYKLLSEASKVKKFLNANKETTANVDSLYEDVNLSLKVTREDLDGLVGDMAGKVVQLLQASIAAADLQMDQIDSIVVIGGTSRQINILSALLDLAPETVARTIDADESVATGAIISAAALMKSVKLKQKFIVNDKVHLETPEELKEKGLDVPPMTEEDFKTCQDQMDRLEEAERKIKQRAEERNSVESIIYKARDDLEAKAYLDYVSEAEVSTFSAKMNEFMDHLDIFGDTETYENLNAIKTELEATLKPLYYRKAQHEGRQEASPLLAATIAQVEKFITASRKVTQEDRGATDADLDAMEASLVEVKNWFDKMASDQEALPLTSDPILIHEEIGLKQRLLDLELSRLKKKKRPVRPKETPKPEEKPSEADPTVEKEKDSSENLNGENSQEEEAKKETEPTAAPAEDAAPSSDEQPKTADPVPEAKEAQLEEKNSENDTKYDEGHSEL